MAVGWAAAAASAVSAMAEARGSGAMPSPAGMSNFDGRTLINMAPADSNVNEMVQHFLGPETNGGFGAPRSRYVSDDPGLTGNTDVAYQGRILPASASQSGGIPWTMLAIGTLALGAVVLVMR